jgi:putative membrane protein
VLGLSAGFLLVIGLLRVFFFEKGAAYYFHSQAKAGEGWRIAGCE